MSNSSAHGEPDPQWPPRQPSPPQKNSPVGKIVGFGCLGLVLLLILILLVVLSLAGGEDGEEPPADEETTSASTPPSGEGAGKGYGDGDHVVGEDIPPGTYESAGAKEEEFDFCSITTEPTNSNTMPQIKNADRGERIVITLGKEDGTVTVQGCEPLKPR